MWWSFSALSTGKVNKGPLSKPSKAEVAFGHTSSMSAHLAPALLSTLIPHHILLEAPKSPASYSSSDKPCSLIPPCFCSCCSSAWHALPLHLHLNISFLPSRYISWVFFLESLAQVPQVPIRGASSIFSVLDAHLYPYLYSLMMSAPSLYLQFLQRA